MPEQKGKEMEIITKDDTLAQIYNLPEFQESADYIVPGGAIGKSPIATMPLTFFEKLGWRPEGMALGFSRIQEICASGKKVVYPLYNEEEISRDESLKEGYMIHFPVEKKAGFVVTCSGGAYVSVASMVEGYPTCREINELGYHAFAVNYRAGQNAKAPNPIDDLAAAVKYIFEHAEELNVDTSNYVIAGFSAGGHLAACFCTESLGWKKYGLPRPTAAFLAYPVITMGKYTHEDSRKNFLQEEADNPVMQEKYSAEKQVTPAYPPTYIWQCERDNTVPVENSRMFAEALKENRVPYEYTTFDSEMHGWGSGVGTLAEGWTKKAVEFWEKVAHKCS